MLEIAGVSKRYANGVHALDNVSLAIDQGLFGLLGPNGAGKSTLMRTLATLQEPDSGTIHLDGQDARANPVNHRQVLGYLPQDFGVYPGISAVALLDHIAVLKGIVHTGERRDQVDALLHMTNLYEQRKRAVSGFSGGMRQRFGIAQALLGAPRLLIVDEPTAGLDPEERNRFHNVLWELGEKVIVILSTHIVDDVRQLCARMAVLGGGRVLQQGEPASLCAALQGKVWSKPVARPELADVHTRYAVLSARLTAGETVVRVLSDDCPAPGFLLATPDLEDVYFTALRSQ